MADKNKPNYEQLIRQKACKGLMDDEFMEFMYVVNKTGLDPLLKQIYAVSRTNNGVKTYTIQTSVEGLRCLAEKTGRYAPGKEPEYIYKEGTNTILYATSTVKKMTDDKTWHEVTARAYWEEYVQIYWDKETKQKKTSHFWIQFPHLMLAKCAESLALKKAFPGELGALYIDEELDQANNEIKKMQELEFISVEQAKEIQELYENLPITEKRNFLSALQVKEIEEITSDKFTGAYKYLKNKTEGGK